MVNNTTEQIRRHEGDMLARSFARVPKHEWEKFFSKDGPFENSDWPGMPVLLGELTRGVSTMMELWFDRKTGKYSGRYLAGDGWERIGDFDEQGQAELELLDGLWQDAKAKPSDLLDGMPAVRNLSPSDSVPEFLTEERIRAVAREELEKFRASLQAPPPKTGRSKKAGG